jgi:hypothetical protein
MDKKEFKIGPIGDQQQQDREPTDVTKQSVGNHIEYGRTSIADANWNDLVIEDQKEPRPFIVTTADGENALYALDWKEGRIEAEELWLVQATDREDAINRVWPFLKPKVLCVDAFDASELRALARAAETLPLSEEHPLVKILTPWCAAVAGRPTERPLTPL